ncbi:MAG: hypothetical protein M0P77_06195 [Firmicutes bacterium]|nr:hypothetical protein [Bacillota bacterium]
MKRKKIFSGNIATLIGVVIIIFMVFISRNSLPISNKVVPSRIVFLETVYNYNETIKASPFSFTRAKVGSKEGYRVLIYRKDKKIDAPQNIYIYIGKKTYLEYKRKPD